MAGVKGIRGEDGANAVEFALVLPILLVMIFGMLTGGILVFQKLGVEQANREAARFAATLPLARDDGSCGPAVQPDDCWFADVANWAVAAAGGELNAGVKGREICVAYIHDDGTNHSKSMIWDANAGPELTGANAHSTSIPGECFPSTVSPAEAHVQVRVNRIGRFDLIFYGNDVSLESRSVALFEPEPEY